MNINEQALRESRDRCLNLLVKKEETIQMLLNELVFCKKQNERLEALVQHYRPERTYEGIMIRRSSY